MRMSLERLGWTRTKWVGIGFGFWETFSKMAEGNHYTEFHCMMGWWVFRVRLWVHLSPPDINQWYYYPIEMPIDAEGNGPCKIDEAASITYEVWDRGHRTHSSHDNLPAAINAAMRLNFHDM